jgi:succinate dehydrogenase/fumarate reductase flavoprotein subunit
MAFRTGAEIINAELSRRHRGPKYFARSGQATWLGVFKDPYGNSIGPWSTKIDRKYSSAIPTAAPWVIEDYAKMGQGPVFLDGSGMSEEDYTYMLHWLENEGCSGIINHMINNGIDIRKTPIEFMRYTPRNSGTIRINTKSETSVKGLYAAGDCGRGIGSMVGAATHGWIAGENATIYAQSTELSRIDRAKDFIRNKKKLIAEIQNRDEGASWKEVNIALQQIMQDYSGFAYGADGICSGSMLEAGLTYVRRLKEKALKTMKVNNQHELMHCLEALNLIDLGEISFIAAIERKETRGQFKRADYPFKDPGLNTKQLVARRENNKIITFWREIAS